MLVFFLNQWKLHHNKGNHKTKHRKEKSKTAFKYLCHGESVSMVADSWGKWRFHRWPDKDSDSSIKLQQEDMPAQLQQAADRLQVIKTVILTGSSQERQILQVEITFHQRATQTSAEDESLSAQRQSRASLTALVKAFFCVTWQANATWRFLILCLFIS